MTVGAFSSVSPLVAKDVPVGGADHVESVGGSGDGDPLECGRILVEPEGGILKKMKDPRLPSVEEVEQHCLRGHIPYRDWCHVCVCGRWASRCLIARRIGNVAFQSIVWITASLGTKWGLNGRSWSEKKD